MNLPSFFKLLICLLLSGCAVSIYYDYDSSVNFSKYKTFAWYQKGHQFINKDFDNEIIESNVKNYASAELKKRGMFIEVDSPDVVFDYEITIEQKTDQVQTPIYGQPTPAPGRWVYNPNTNQYVYRHPYNYNGYNPYYSGAYIAPTPYIVGYKTDNVPYEEGTLTIKAIDRKTNRLIWKGWSVGTVTDEQSYESELYSDIHRIFNRFPMKPIKY